MNFFIAGLDFCMMTMFCGLFCLIFGSLWLYFGQVSNIFMAVFFLPFGIFLLSCSIWSGISEYHHWKGYQNYQTNAYAAMVQ